MLHNGHYVLTIFRHTTMVWLEAHSMAIPYWSPLVMLSSVMLIRNLNTFNLDVIPLDVIRDPMYVPLFGTDFIRFLGNPAETFSCFCKTERD